ncbi:MAG: SGNH/GDSL hydrolase family protein [Proteobacteria bacterium]|nr:SGNH/GDSL hydrolase family protein [Pseudomonadota bacterium]
MSKGLGLNVVLVFLMLFSIQLQAQTTRVLIVGDSWAEQQWTDQVHDVVFDANGYGDTTVNGDSTAISGSEAADWVAPSQLQLIADALDSNLDIDTVQLTIGGNDFLAAWSANMSEPDELLLQQQISANIQTIIDFILLQNADTEVILSFYDYPNFVDTLTGLSGVFCNPLYNDMAQPSPNELNSAATSFEAVYAQLALNNPRVFYVSHLGLMQFNYGFPADGIQPGDLPTLCMRHCAIRGTRCTPHP